MENKKQKKYDAKLIKELKSLSSAKARQEYIQKLDGGDAQEAAYAFASLGYRKEARECAIKDHNHYDELFLTSDVLDYAAAGIVSKEYLRSTYNSELDIMIDLANRGTFGTDGNLTPKNMVGAAKFLGLNHEQMKPLRKLIWSYYNNIKKEALTAKGESKQYCINEAREYAGMLGIPQRFLRRHPTDKNSLKKVAKAMGWSLEDKVK